MLRTTTSRWMKRIGLAGVAAAGLFAATLPTAPAQAQVVVGFGAPYYAPTMPRITTAIRTVTQAASISALAADGTTTTIAGNPATNLRSAIEPPAPPGG